MANEEAVSKATANAYWRANIRLLLILLVIWFAVSFGAGIIFVDALNQIEIPGFKLGFWFAQQGSIFVFVVLIFVYTWRMKKLDRQFDVDDSAEPDSYDVPPSENGNAPS
ncbi:MAG: DUF4212 domain-containing protein [Proteobacteria bacterium]|jgi:putative solute:sodium symporter small subunit|nr:DUF4212 domain-containing protein [Pseudomonadota bacterium]